MKTFQKKVESQKQTKTLILQNVNNEQKEEIKIFENEQNGKIAAKDLKSAMQILGFEQSIPKIIEVFKELDKMEVDVTFNEYLNLLRGKLEESDVELVISKIFELFDDKKQMTISFNDLKKLAKDLNKDINQSELQELLERASSNGKEITQADFYNIMTKKTF